MKIDTLAPGDAIEAVTQCTDIDEVREAATSINITFSGNTGLVTLKQKISDAIVAKMDADDNAKNNLPDNGPLLVTAEEEDEEIEVAKAPVRTGPSVAEMMKMDPTKVEDAKLRRLVIRAQALRLKRVRVQNMDPNDSMLEGMILSISTKYTGKVSKYIAFDEQSANGYHIPQILLDHLVVQEFPFRKEIKGGQFGVKKYKTTMMKKFIVTELPPLTKEEIEELKAHQRAANTIDRNA